MARNNWGHANEVLRLGDAGKTLAVSGDSLQFNQGLVTTRAMLCVLRITKASDAVAGQVRQTRALDGRQTGTYGDVSVSWSYHPDSGVSAVFTEK